VTTYQSGTTKPIKCQEFDVAVTAETEAFLTVGKEMEELQLPFAGKTDDNSLIAKELVDALMDFFFKNILCNWLLSVKLAHK
jgi:hypothetical protein